MGSTPIGISGSRAAAILGMSPWQTPLKVWQDIMEARQAGFNAARGYEYEAFEGNASTRWGLAFEDAIVKLAEERYMSINDREQMYAYGGKISKDDSLAITCHIDGMYGYDKKLDAVKILHEGKTTTSYGFGDKWGEPGSDKIPVEYQIQTQHQMLCTGADEAIVSVLVFPKRPDDWEAEGWKLKHTAGLGDSNFPPYYSLERELSTHTQCSSPKEWARTLNEMGYFHQYTIPADRDLQAHMLDKYREWWDLWVIGETAPPPVDYTDIRAMITAPTGTIIVDSDTARWFKEFKDIGSEIGASGNLAKRRDQLKTLILKRGYVREHEMCPHDKMLDYTTCHGECGQVKCTIGKGRPVLDDESVDKWIFRDDRGN